MFSNLIGCDGERVYYDGGSMISVNGQIIAEGPQFTLDEVVRTRLLYIGLFMCRFFTAIKLSSFCNSDNKTPNRLKSNDALFY